MQRSRKRTTAVSAVRQPPGHYSCKRSEDVSTTLPQAQRSRVCPAPVQQPVKRSSEPVLVARGRWDGSGDVFSRGWCLVLVAHGGVRCTHAVAVVSGWDAADL